jgi:hypothetical protein
VIEYAFQDADGVQTLINGDTLPQIEGNSLAQGEDVFSWENKIVENSFLPGEKKLGTTRLQGRAVSFVLQRTAINDSDFRDGLNAMIKAFETCEYLVDLTNSLRMKVAPLDYSSAPLAGGEKRITSDAFSLRMLEPWEDLTANTDGPTALTGLTFNDILLTNDGFLDSYPVLTFTASVAVDDIQILIPENSGSFQIQDTLFGTSPAYDTLVIDCQAGTSDLGGADRGNFIVPGTGFIQFPSGDLTLRIFPSASCSVTVEWRSRFYV